MCIGEWTVVSGRMVGDVHYDVVQFLGLYSRWWMLRRRYFVTYFFNWLDACILSRLCIALRCARYVSEHCRHEID